MYFKLYCMKELIFALYCKENDKRAKLKLL